MSLLENHKHFHWWYYRLRKRHLFNTGMGVFVWLFLSLTQPFGIYMNNFPSYSSLVFYLTIFGLLWTLCIYLVQWVSGLLFNARLSENFRMDFRGWITFLVVVINAQSFLRAILCQWSCMSIQEYIESYLAGILLFVILYLPTSLYARSRHLQLKEKDQENPWVQLELHGKQNIRFVLDDLVYFKSDDNYVDIYYISNGDEIRKKTVRSSLRSIESQLERYPGFLRTHRSYIVNMKYLSSMPNRSILFLVPKYGEIEIPVSKSYQKSVISFNVSDH